MIDELYNDFSYFNVFNKTTVSETETFVIKCCCEIKKKELNTVL